MTRQTRAAAVMPLLLIVMTALLLAGCGGSQGLAPVSSQPLVARTRVPVLFHDAAETTFLQPAEPLTDGPAANLHGLYGSSGAGETSLGLCRLEGLWCRSRIACVIAWTTSDSGRVVALQSRSMGPADIDGSVIVLHFRWLCHVGQHLECFLAEHHACDDGLDR